MRASRQEFVEGGAKVMGLGFVHSSIRSLGGFFHGGRFVVTLNWPLRSFP